MDAGAALEFVESHGVVLVAAKGPVPRMTEAIAGEPIVGQLVGAPEGPRDLRGPRRRSRRRPDVLVCRAVSGKVTLVHRRLWPALICAADVLGAERLARVEQEHTAAGHHVNHETPFPQWADAAAAVGRGAR